MISHRLNGVLISRSIDQYPYANGVIRKTRFTTAVDELVPGIAAAVDEIIINLKTLIDRLHTEAGYQASDAIGNYRCRHRNARRPTWKAAPTRTYASDAGYLGSGVAAVNRAFSFSFSRPL